MSTWSLIVCTLDRPNVLLESLRLAATQTRLPDEIIVVDASRDWETTRRAVSEAIANLGGVKLNYLHSPRRSLAAQRNLGLEVCASDIVFFLDDDSFMYPDCAAEVMRVYEADRATRLGGVTTTLMARAPWDPPAAETASGAPRPLLANVLHTIQARWNPERMFIPYAGVAPSHSRTDNDPSILDTVAVSLFHGCRMTFRTSAVREVGGFEDALIRNSLAEDLDLSYRVSQHSALVLAPKARIYHMKVPLSRADNRYKNAALTILNASALYWLHADPASRRAAKVYRFGAERLALELMRDALKPWRGFPHVRGSLHALKRVPSILSRERDELRRWYPQVQADVLGD